MGGGRPVRDAVAARGNAKNAKGRKEREWA